MEEVIYRRPKLFTITNRIMATNRVRGFKDSQKMVQKEQEKPKNFPKSPPFSLWQWYKDQFQFYCSITALHGWNFVIRKEYAPWERIMWAFISIIAIIVASILLWISLHWTSQTPTVTVIESTHYPTWNIPFPAVTICNLNKISAKAIARRIKLL